jgi:hypothetical protein
LKKKKKGEGGEATSRGPAFQVMLMRRRGFESQFCYRRTSKKKKGEGDEASSRGPAFQVTAQGEDGHGKKQGLDYLFQLYEEAGRILEEIKIQEKATGKKPSTKVRRAGLVMM